MKTRLDKSIEYIRGYCGKHFCCEECKLNNDMKGHCSLKDLPLNWKTLQEKKQNGRADMRGEE